MEKLQMLAMIQAYTGIGIGLMIGVGAAGTIIMLLVTIVMRIG